jgi:diguanylate cyclase (GGDEF)-like protein
LVHPDYRANFDQTWHNLLSNPTRQVTTYPMWIQTGGYIWVESNARVVCDPVTGKAREVVSIVRDVTSRVAEQQELLKAYKHVEALATTEPLTGLANRRRFDEALLNEWKKALCNQTALSLLMIDIDNFKIYNDHYGHLAGDHCLKTVADTLLRNVFRPEDVIARYGGEEFAILLPNTPAPNASEVAERLRSAIERKQMDVKSDLRVHTTISVGIACMQPKVEETPNILIAAADEALYTAKRNGKNCVVNGSLANE